MRQASRLECEFCASSSSTRTRYDTLLARPTKQTLSLTWTPRGEHVAEDTTRTAIVTGAAQGIGAAIAQKLASDGMRVAVVDLDEGACARTVDAIKAAGGTALAVGAAVSDAGALNRAGDRSAAGRG